MNEFPWFLMILMWIENFEAKFGNDTLTEEKIGDH